MIRKIALALAAVAAVSTVAIAPADARWRGGPGPGLALGAVAGALALGAVAASQPRYYAPGYAPGYYPGPRAYYYGGGSYNCNAYYDTVCGGPYNYAPAPVPGDYYSPY
jgi:hypothetical protein